MQYFIIENQLRADGVVNTTTTSRSTFANALQYYHERISKMVVTNLFTSVHIMLCDEQLNVIEKKDVPTLFDAQAETTE